MPNLNSHTNSKSNFLKEYDTFSKLLTNSKPILQFIDFPSQTRGNNILDYLDFARSSKSIFNVTRLPPISSFENGLPERC